MLGSGVAGSEEVFGLRTGQKYGDKNGGNDGGYHDVGQDGEKTSWLSADPGGVVAGPGETSRRTGDPEVTIWPDRAGAWRSWYG